MKLLMKLLILIYGTNQLINDLEDETKVSSN